MYEALAEGAGHEDDLGHMSVLLYPLFIIRTRWAGGRGGRGRDPMPCYVARPRNDLQLYPRKRARWATRDEWRTTIWWSWPTS